MHPDPSRVASRHLAFTGTLLRFLPRDWPHEAVSLVQEIADEMIEQSVPEHRSQFRRSEFTDAEIRREVSTWAPLLFKRIEQGRFARDSDWAARMVGRMELEMESAIRDYMDDLQNP